MSPYSFALGQNNRASKERISLLDIGRKPPTLCRSAMHPQNVGDVSRQRHVHHDQPLPLPQFLLRSETRTMRQA
eukprot:767076-Hanusia_phi.AAC.3